MTLGINMKKGKLISSEKKKIKILSVSKDDYKQIWRFERSQAFMPSILQFLVDIGFTKKDFEIRFFFGIPHEEDEELDESYIKEPFSKKYLSIDLFNQDIYSFSKKDLDVELIFFNDKIELITRINKRSIDVGELISKFALFGKEK